MKLIDSHIHLNCIDHPPELYKRIPSIIPGVRGKDLRTTLNTFPNSHISCGIHPMFIEESIPLDELSDQIKKVQPIAIGECGLDRRNSNLEQQLEYFEAQIQLSLDHQLPLIIHLVGHLDLFLKFLKEYHFKAYIHFFGLKQMPELLLTEEIYFGFCSRLPVDSKAFKLFRDIPVEKILIETDGDDEYPPEEQDLEKTYHLLANLKNIPVEELSEQISLNNQTFFKHTL
jgi:TatD DNase family protein